MKEQRTSKVKDILFSTSVFAFALFILYATYKSFGPDKREINYISEINQKYANIYVLKSTIFHSPEYEISAWADEAKSYMLNDINDFCVVADNSLQKPILNSVLHKDKPKLLEKRLKVYQVTAFTEFECKETPL